MKIFVLVLSALVSSAFAASKTLRGHRHAQAVATVGSISELRWIDANSNQRVDVDGSNIVPVQTVPEFADTIDGYEVPNVPLTMEALTTGPVGSVKFTYFSTATSATVTTIENVAPYALCANVGSDFLPCAGLRESGGMITAQVFSGPGATGEASAEYLTWIRYVYKAEPTGTFVVYNADTDTTTGSAGLYDITVNRTATPSVAITVDAVGARYRWWPASATLDYDNGAPVVWENTAPFVFPYNQGSNFGGFTPTVGVHTLAATLYSKPNFQGQNTTWTVTMTVLA